MDDDVTTASGIRIPAHALQWRFERSGGPGGQNVNKVSSKAHLTVDVGDMTGPERVLALVRDNLGDQIAVTSQTSRSQWRNRELCIERLIAQIDAATVVEEPRRATKVPRRVRERRLQDKRKTSERKRRRRTLDD